MIRREKAKVLPQLPDKTRVDLYVEISNDKEYNLAAEDLAAYLQEYTECIRLGDTPQNAHGGSCQVYDLALFGYKGKDITGVDFIRTFLDSGKKLIVFCSLHEIVDELQKVFPRAVTVTGVIAQ